MTYWPFARSPYGTMTIAVRTAGAASGVVNAIAGVVREMDPDLVVANVRTMEEVVADSVAERRLTMLLLAIFAGAALLLAAVGIYGVIAYSVTQRTQEIGIRMALGAQRGDVLRMIVGQAMALTAAGIVSGAIGAFLLTRVMTGLLFNVTPGDPLTFVRRRRGARARCRVGELRSRPPRDAGRSCHRAQSGMSLRTGPAKAGHRPKPPDRRRWRPALAGPCTSVYR